MIKKLLIGLMVPMTVALTACQNGNQESALISQDDVVLVMVDGQPITLPMLEFMMETRGIGEDDHEAMRALLDELIRLRVVASAAEEAGMDREPRVRAHQMIGHLEVLKERYFRQIAEEDPVTDEQIEAAYAAQVERTGGTQYRIDTLIYPDQPAVLNALAQLEGGSVSFDDLAAAADQSAIRTEPPLWVDLSQVPPEIGALLADAENNSILELPLQTPQGWRIIRVRDRREIEIPTIDEVRQGVARHLATERLNQVVGELYQAAEITPMLPLEDRVEGD